VTKLKGTDGGKFGARLRVLWEKHVFIIKIHYHVVEVCGNSVMILLLVRKWRRGFENGTGVLISP
jgi:hypothetical protein